MRSLIMFITILASVLAMVWCAAVEQPGQIAAETLLDVDSGIGHSNEGVRQARQFYGYYGRPYYGGYGGYYSPYYGGYGYGRPYYGYYGGYYRPYYYGYGGFFG